MSDFSVVIPAKNESLTIGELIRSIVNLTGCEDVIVVDDGSSDNTSAIAEEAGARVVSHPYSKGNGAAIKTGARSAFHETVVFMDADGQHDPQDIYRLIQKIEDGYDLVVGARVAGSQASIIRGFANKCYNKLATYMTGHKVEDLTSGFRAVRREKFLEFLSLLPNGFSYPTTSTMAFFRSGYSVAYVPIIASNRVKGSKSHINLWRDGVRFLLIIFKIGTLFSPLKIFFPVSLGLGFGGFVYYAYTYFTDGRFTNMGALLFTTAMLVFMIGLVSEQVTALMYKEKE